MACVNASYLSLYDFPAVGPGVPKRGLLGLRFLRNVAKAAAAWFPRFHEGTRGTDFGDLLTDSAAPTRGARQIPERLEV